MLILYMNSCLRSLQKCVATLMTVSYHASATQGNVCYYDMSRYVCILSYVFGLDVQLTHNLDLNVHLHVFFSST